MTQKEERTLGLDIIVIIEVLSIKQDIGHVNFGVQNLYQI